MSTSRRLVRFVPALALLALAVPSSAFGQATRTWVSGVGDDANPCSRTAPCKTFAGAISKTANGGEINCLDPGGFGGVTIGKSLTIKCHYTEGGGLGPVAHVQGPFPRGRRPRLRHERDGRERARDRQGHAPRPRHQRDRGGRPDLAE